MIQVFKKSDGKPFLFDNEEDYDKEIYTDIMPPSSLYLPVYFDGEKWIGTPYEVWEEQRQKDLKEMGIDETDLIGTDEMIANLSVELMNTQKELQDARKEIAELTITVLGGNNDA